MKRLNELLIHFREDNIIVATVELNMHAKKKNRFLEGFQVSDIVVSLDFLVNLVSLKNKKYYFG